MSDLRDGIPPSFCPYAVEVASDTYVGCSLPAGHKGPCKPHSKAETKE